MEFSFIVLTNQRAKRNYFCLFICILIFNLSIPKCIQCFLCAYVVVHEVNNCKSPMSKYTPVWPHIEILPAWGNFYYYFLKCANIRRVLGKYYFINLCVSPIFEAGQKDSQVHTYNKNLQSTFLKFFPCFQSGRLVLGKQVCIVSDSFNA